MPAARRTKINRIMYGALRKSLAAIVFIMRISLSSASISHQRAAKQTSRLVRRSLADSTHDYTGPIHGPPLVAYGGLQPTSPVGQWFDKLTILSPSKEPHPTQAISVKTRRRFPGNTLYLRRTYPCRERILTDPPPPAGAATGPGGRRIAASSRRNRMKRQPLRHQPQYVVIPSPKKVKKK